MRAPLHNEIQHASKIWHIQDMTYIPHYTTIYRIPIWYLVKCLIWYMLYVHAFNGARATKMQVHNSSCLLTQLIQYMFDNTVHVAWKYMNMQDGGSRTSGHLWSILVTFFFWLCAESCCVHLLLGCNLINCQSERLQTIWNGRLFLQESEETMKKPSRHTTNQISGLLCRIISDEILLRLAAEGQIASADRRKSDS